MNDEKNVFVTYVVTLPALRLLARNNFRLIRPQTAATANRVRTSNANFRGRWVVSFQIYSTFCIEGSDQIMAPRD